MVSHSNLTANAGGQSGRHTSKHFAQPPHPTAPVATPPRLRLVNLFESICLALLFVLCALLSVFTLIFTASTDYRETSYAIDTARLVPVLLLAIAFCAAMSLQRLGHLFARANPRIVALVALAYGVIASTLWIFLAQVGEAYDSSFIIQCARYLYGMPEVPFDWTTWAENGYVWHYPFQIPYILLMYSTMWIADGQFLILAQLLNAAANGFTLFFVVKITDALFGRKEATLISCLLSVLFGGLVFYATWTYGNLVSLPFMLAAFYLETSAFARNQRGKRRFGHPVARLVAASFLLAISCLLKSTFVIALIAFALVLLAHALRSRNPLALVLCVLPYLLYSLSSGAITGAVGKAMGVDYSNHVPSTTWLVMGIGGGAEYDADATGDESLAYDTNLPGFFRGYVWPDPESNQTIDYDSLNQRYLAERLQRFAGDPGFAAEFFSRKLLIEWTEPTYGSILSSNWDREDVPDNASTRRAYTHWGYEFYYGLPHEVCTMAMDLGQTLVAVGALAAFAHQLHQNLGRRRRTGLTAEALLPAVFTIGGAILYLAWETKSQYVMPFYLTLIPYSAGGWSFICDAILRPLNRGRHTDETLSAR